MLSKIVLYNKWWPAVQGNHEAFKIALSQREQVLFIEREGLEFFEEKQCEYNEQKIVLKATTLTNVSALKAYF